MHPKTSLTVLHKKQRHRGGFLPALLGAVGAPLALAALMPTFSHLGHKIGSKIFKRDYEGEGKKKKKKRGGSMVFYGPSGNGLKKSKKKHIKRGKGISAQINTQTGPLP